MKLYSVPEAAEMLGVSRATIYRLFNSGELEKTKVRGACRIPSDAIDAYIAAIRA